MGKIEAELIINTRSRRSRLVRKKLLESLEAHGIHITHVNEIKRNQPLSSVAPGILSRSPRLLIAAGGDGTISDVVDHLVGKSIDIGVVPLGTTNNFARSLNIPLDVDGAVRSIKENKARPVDLGMVNGDYFTNVAGIGLSALVARKVTDKTKRRWGRFAYTLVGIRQLFAHKAFMVTIKDKDGELKLNFETHQVIIANGRFHAGKKIAVGARLDSRELVIFALGGRSKASFIWSMLDFYIGKRKNITHSSYLIAKNIRLETSSPQMVELDGEVKFKTPVKTSVEPRAIKICYAP